MYQGGVVYRQKKKEEARGFSTVRGVPQNGDGRVEADFAIMCLTAQPRHKICIFSNVAPKTVRKRGKCKRTKSDPKSPGEKHKKRPEVAWWKTQKSDPKSPGEKHKKRPEVALVKNTKSDPKSPGEQHKKRPEVAWWKTQKATRSCLVYRDDAEGDWASRCRRSENTSRGQAKNFNCFESHAQHLPNEDESGRLKPDL